jgi:glutamyl/glutaminyl-tRNA synthetase
MVEAFDDRRIGTSPAIFDVTRLDWFNGHYIRALSPERLTELALPFLLKGLPEDVAATVDPAYARQVFVLDQERFKTLADVPLLTSFFFIEQPEYDAPLLGKGMDAERATKALDAVIAVLGEQSELTPEALLRALDGTVERLGYIRTKADGSQVPDRGPVFMLVRVGVSGRKETPGLTEMMTVLGRERVLRRLQAAMEKLQTLAG